MRTRRRFLACLAGGLLVSPARAFAQSPRSVRRVGVLGSRRRPDSLETDSSYGQIPRRLRELGYLEGRDVDFEWRFAAGDYRLLPGMAAELVKVPVDVIISDGAQSIRAAQDATRRIPIVFAGGADVVASGFVKSLARPGGNTTGVTLLLSDTRPKQVEMLRQMTPTLSRLALLFNPSNPAHPDGVARFQTAAKAAGVQTLAVGATNPRDIEAGISRAAGEGANGLLVIVDSLFLQQHRQIADLAIVHRLPSITGTVSFADDGGLMGYGPNRTEVWRRVADLVDKIFKGANPGEIPVEQPTKLELAINRRTAKALGLTVPPELLLLADKVIE